MYLLNTIVFVSSVVVTSRTAKDYGPFLLSGSNLEWPSAAEESDDIRCGRYEPRKILVHGVQMDGERAYVTMPRFARTGVPWTLGSFRLDAMDFEPDILPYPDYRSYGPSCRGGNVTAACILNVVDVYVDDGTLWALDTGTAGVLGRRPSRMGPPRLIAIDLAADRVTAAVDLSPVIGPRSALQHLVARRTSCGRLFVYVADAAGHAIIAYDVNASRLHAIPLPETVSAAHHRRVVLHLMAVSRAGKSYVYFTYRQSGTVFALDSWSRESVTHGSVVEVGAKPVDMIVLGTDRGTDVYFRAPDATDVWAWDVNRPLDVRSFRLVHRSYLYLMPTAVVAGWRNAVWTVESNYDEYVTGNVDCTGPRTLLRPIGGNASACGGQDQV
jgi:hypothetical protein